ncbi:aspartyl protease APCB1 isoform X2 [Amborella trichopoda]|uniref:aspartyl protease APCB1 isoform X2 n=1 Tax=Amborella trichopoda TaxID=13333 RepID=UPI0009BE89E3|nr:aspartyl protease APCB1 isoform X2 [Amborella trichopoda]|eukprot:XP_020530678.1 aspartyl protease APCB1 isoform X2 [Amborella trichopoda]
MGLWGLLVLVGILHVHGCLAALKGGGNLDLGPNSQRNQRTLSSTTTLLFPLVGDVHPTGVYYVSIDIGNPPKPYFLHVDTGSDLTWLQCDAPCRSCSKGPHPFYRPTKNKLVSCKDPLCISLKSLRSYPCDDPTQQCDYEIEYADHGSSLGVLVRDSFHIRITNGSLIHRHLAFGCGYDQQGSQATSTTDGILGLRNSDSGIVSQFWNQGVIRNVIGHCIDGQLGRGYLFLGDDLVPSSGMTWVPMTQSYLSGTSFTYFTSLAYQALISRLRKDLAKTSLKELPIGPHSTLPLCWRGTKAFKSLSEIKGYFKPLVMNFKNGKRARFEISPEGFLIITSQGNVCLGILNGSEVGLLDHILIGDISLHGYLVVYDNENHQIGWVPQNCNRLPKLEGNGFGDLFSRPYASDMGIFSGDQLQCPATPTRERSNTSRRKSEG